MSIYANGNSGASKTIVFGNCRQSVVLSANTTLTITCKREGRFCLHLVTGATPRTVTWIALVFGTTTFTAAALVTALTAANKTTILEIDYDGAVARCCSWQQF
jgi:hypothetical protein